MVWSMGDGKNLILLRTANFLLKDLRRCSLCSCQECLQALIIPRHLEDDLKLIILSANTKSSPAVMKIREIIDIKGKQCRL